MAKFTRLCLAAFAASAIAAPTASSTVAAPAAASKCSKPRGNLNTNPTGPLFDSAFPDPRAVEVNGVYYGFSTNHAYKGKHANAPVAQSNHSTHGWEPLGIDALPNPGSWALKDSSGDAHVWASSVTQISNNSFVMYYSAWHKDSGNNGRKHCMGAATATTVTGPYTPAATPAICPPQGAIDGQGFIYQGTNYLVHKVGGHFDGKHVSHIWLQEMDAAGTSKAAGKAPVHLLENTGSEYDTEGPALTLSPDGKTFFLWFVTGFFRDPDYAIRYTTSTSLFGPYPNDNPPYLLQTGSYNGVYLVGPGGPSFTNATQLYFMSDVPDADCTVTRKSGLKRQIHAATIQYDGNTAKLAPA